MSAELRLAWTIRKLSRVLDLDDRTLLKLLAAKKVPVYRVSERVQLVWLCDLADAWPQFERSLRVARDAIRISGH